MILAGGRRLTRGLTTRSAVDDLSSFGTADSPVRLRGTVTIAAPPTQMHQDGWCLSSLDVDFMTDRLQMRWIDTPSNTAQMVEHQARGNWSDQCAIRPIVGGDYTRAIIEVPVPVTHCADPDPARTCPDHLRPEPLGWRSATASHTLFPHTGHGAMPRAARKRSATAICCVFEARCADAAYCPPP